jgi:hypothetical protein
MKNELRVLVTDRATGEPLFISRVTKPSTR